MECTSICASRDPGEGTNGSPTRSTEEFREEVWRGAFVGSVVLRAGAGQGVLNGGATNGCPGSLEVLDRCRLCPGARWPEEYIVRDMMFVNPEEYWRFRTKKESGQYCLQLRPSGYLCLITRV